MEKIEALRDLHLKVSSMENFKGKRKIEKQILKDILFCSMHKVDERLVGLMLKERLKDLNYAKEKSN